MAESNFEVNKMLEAMLNDPDQEMVLVVCEGNLDAIKLQRKIEEAGMSCRAIVASGEQLIEQEPQVMNLKSIHEDSIAEAKLRGEEAFIKEQKKQDQPWRDRGRSKKDRRHHR